MIQSVKSVILLGLLAILIPASLMAKEKLSDKISLSTKFYLHTNSDIAFSDNLALGVELDTRFEPSDTWELGLEIDAAYDGVDADEIWLRYKAKNRMRYQLGMFENELLLEDQFSVKDLPFKMDALTRRHMDYAGWYSKRAMGFKTYHNYKEGSLPLSTYAHVLYHPGGREVQFNGGIFYPFRKNEESWLGLSAAWYPYWIHVSWVGTDSSYVQENNYIFQAVIADISGDDGFIYRGSATTGSNLVDPVGITHIPGDGEPSWFAGADMMVGMPIGDKEFRWTPALEASWLTYDLNNPESWRLDLRTGHQLAWNKTFYLHLEGGLGILTNFNSTNGISILQTSLEEIWGISLQVRL